MVRLLFTCSVFNLVIESSVGNVSYLKKAPQKLCKNSLLLSVAVSNLLHSNERVFFAMQCKSEEIMKCKKGVCANYLLHNWHSIRQGKYESACCRLS